MALLMLVMLVTVVTLVATDSSASTTSQRMSTRVSPSQAMEEARRCRSSSSGAPRSELDRTDLILLNRTLNLEES